MSIIKLAVKLKQQHKAVLSTMAFSLMLMFFIVICGPATALAASEEDVLAEVAQQTSDFHFYGSNGATYPVPGGSFKSFGAFGYVNSGWVSFNIDKPVGNTPIQAVIDYETGQLADDAILNVVPMTSYELGEITFADYSWGLPNDEVEVWIILPQYLIRVNPFDTGYDQATNLQLSKDFALQLMGGLERAGLLIPSTPDTPIENPAEEDATPADVSATTGNPLSEPVKISDTMNIAAVYNGPTAPTTFSISIPHLLTYISTYHWNNAQGAFPGTIAIQHENGTIYGPWQVTTRPGQGGVPNAYWEVFPNIVIPAGTYTIVDSDPATWAQNVESGGKGMGEVRATPEFEVTSGTVDSLDKGNQGNSPGGSGWTESPAGVGSVGNIPGPANTTEAIVGVAVPGLIATVLGALAGLGGGGGFAPPGGTPLSPTAGGPSPGVPGTGGSYPGTGTGQPGVNQDANHLGRKRRNEEGSIASGIRIDTADMGQGAITTSSGDPLIIETPDKEAIFGKPDSGIIIEPPEEKVRVIKPESGISTEDYKGGIIIDTSAFEDNPPAQTDGAPTIGEAGTEAAMNPDGQTTGIGEESGYDQAGYNQEGFDAEGFDRQGFNQEGFDKAGFNAQGFDRQGFNQEGFDKAGFDAEGFDRQGFDQEGFDKAGFDAEGFDRQGFNQEGFDKAGFDAEGFDQEGFDKAGFDAQGFDRQGYGRNGFNSEGFDREGFDVNGYNAKGYNRSGYNAKGYNAAGYDKEGFNQEGWDKAGYDRNGFNRNGFDREGYDKAGYDKDGYNREGYDREGLEREGYDENGYDKNGYNRNGVDKDGFDREGFDYEGYNRSGYDPWGYNKQGYGKDGYHWSGYNADGYNRDGRHWSENPFEGDGNPFNVAKQDPFGQGEVIPFGAEWKATKPPLGEPYPKTLDKYGAKPWTNEPAPTVPAPEDKGIIGPEEPMNTLKHQGTDKEAPAVPESQGTGHVDQPVQTGDSDTFTYTDPKTGKTSTYEYEKGYNGPRQGDTQILVGKTDGQTYEIEFNAVKGKWVNTETGNDFDPEDFERWQNDLAVDKKQAAMDSQKMAAGQDANRKPIDENQAQWKTSDKMQQAADEGSIETPGGPDNADKAIPKLKKDDYNEQGYNKDGYNRSGFNKDGWDNEGYDVIGLDRQGYDRNGLDVNGFTREHNLGKAIDQIIKDKNELNHYVRNPDWHVGKFWNNSFGRFWNEKLGNWKGGQCGEYVEWGTEWLKDDVKHIYGEDVIIDKILIERNDMANHVANLIILPNGERKIVDFWDGIQKGEGKVMDEKDWLEKWDAELGKPMWGANKVTRDYWQDTLLNDIKMAGDTEKGIANFLDYVKKKSPSNYKRALLVTKSYRKDPWSDSINPVGGSKGKF